MWRKGTPNASTEQPTNRISDFKALLRYINYLASHKLGYPVSLLTYLGIINNKVLGIRPNSLANVLLNNVGDPFKDSETSLMEVKVHEREVIAILERYYGLHPNEARGYVTTGGTEGNFAALWWSKRFLINSALDNLIEHDNKIKLLNKQEQELSNSLNKISLNDYEARINILQKIIEIKNEINNHKNTNQQTIVPTVFFSKEHTHYSIGKIAEILRLNIKAIASNVDGTIDLNAFRKELLFNMQAYPNSPVIVIANIGTTVTGAIDDVPGIRKILDESVPKPLYSIHMDGALTGFVMPILKPFGDIKNYFDDLGANTLAVSAHKFPGLSQPCGIILARRSFFEKAFERSERNIEYVGNILDITISGSRSGLNVLMFYNALHTLGMHHDNLILNEMVNSNLRNARYLYNELCKIFGPDSVYYPYHFNVCFPRPSSEIAKKYQLMITGNRATICVLTNVSKELIDQFIVDLKEDQKEKTMSTIKTEYSIVSLTDAYAKQATELFTKTFCDSEPITKHVHITYADYEPFAREVVTKAIKEGLSKVAIDKQNKVIALCIAEDLANATWLDTGEKNKKLAPIFGLLKEVSKPFLKDKRFHKGKIAHIMIAAVDINHRGLGLSTEIEMAVIEQAARRGFEFAYTEFSNELSEKVSKQFNTLKMLNRIKYDDFSMDSRYPFKGIKGSASAYVACIKPGVKLDSLPTCYSVVEKT